MSGLPAADHSAPLYCLWVPHSAFGVRLNYRLSPSVTRKPLWANPQFSTATIDL